MPHNVQLSVINSTNAVLTGEKSSSCHLI